MLCQQPVYLWVKGVVEEVYIFHAQFRTSGAYALQLENNQGVRNFILVAH